MAEQQSQHLDVASDIDAIDKLFDVDGLRLVDVGCGAGDLARALAGRGADVVALEPDPTQAATNAEADPVNGVTFVEASAQSMPLDAASVDGVIFSRSLHHVPANAMDGALNEARRVLKPGDGFLFVLEPEVTGTYHDLLKPFHDESEVRRLARAALDRFAENGFTSCEFYVYETGAEFSRFEEFRDRYANASYLSFDVKDVDSADVRRAFESGFDGTMYRFTAPHWIGLYRGVALEAESA